MRDQRDPLVLCLAAVMVSACGGSQTMVLPPSLPAISADWLPMAFQVPSDVDFALLGTFDPATQADLGETFGGLILLDAVASEAADALGLDPAGRTFDQLGLRPGGGFSLFLRRRRWVGIVDLADSEVTRGVLERLVARNPDWATTWREVDGEDVLTVAFGQSARIHLMLLETRLIGVVQVSGVMGDEADDLSDELLAETHRADWDETLLFNRRFGEAVRRWGGDVWSLWLIETAAVLEALPPGPGAAEPSWLGPAPSPERCRETVRAIGRALPYAVGVTQRRRDATGGHFVDNEEQHAAFHVTGEYELAAAALLPHAPIDRTALTRRALVAGFVNLEPSGLASGFGGYADAAACPGVAAVPGLLGRLGDLIEDSPAFGGLLDGLVVAALFDIRRTGGVHFADLYVGLGSSNPLGLSRVFQRLFEDDLGLNGTAEVVAGFQTVHYRFALLYRVALWQGPAALGLTVGIVEENWLQQVLARPEVPDPAFLFVELDGQALRPVVDVLAELIGTTLEDESLPLAERGIANTWLEDLRNLRRLVLTGRFEEQTIHIDLAESRNAGEGPEAP